MKKKPWDTAFLERIDSERQDKRLMSQVVTRAKQRLAQAQRGTSGDVPVPALRNKARAKVVTGCDRLPKFTFYTYHPDVAHTYPVFCMQMCICVVQTSVCNAHTSVYKPRTSVSRLSRLRCQLSPRHHDLDLHPD